MSKSLTKLAERVEFWADRLYLHGWEFDVEFAVRPEGRSSSWIACVKTDSQYDEATLQFNKEKLKELKQTQIDVYIVHELLHVMMRDLDEAIESVMEFFSHREWTLWKERVDHEEEGLVMRLAEIIVLQHSAKA